MRLVPYEKLAERLNLASHLADEQALGAVLDAATTYVEGVLRTQLSAAVREDYFSPVRSRLGKFSPFKLGLSQKFATDIFVYASPDGLPITDVNDATLLVEGLDWVVENAYGDIQILRDWGVGPHTYVVAYDCGFVDENDAGIPAWLQSAAVSAATLIRHTNTISHNKKDVKDLSPEIRKQVYAMVAPYIVPSMGYLFPSKSVVTQ